MGETKFILSKPAPIPDWMWREVSEYDLPLTFTPATVLDIGANIGAFTLLALQRWPEARITAVEPMPENCAGFLDNIDLNKSTTVVLHSAALRAFDGHDKIWIGDRGVTCGFHQIGRQTQETKLVRCLDAASVPSAEFVKIDTEGSELEIVQRLDLSATKVLCVEYHFAGDVIPIVEIAESHGLRLHRQKPIGDTWGLLILAQPGCIAGETKPRQKVFVALPVYGGLDPFFSQALIKLIHSAPFEMALRMNPGDSLVSRSRNTLTADFLESDCTHLLFIDTDLVFSGEQIQRLLEHDVDIVGGFYPKKQEGPIEWVCNACLPPQPVLPNGLQEVRYMGTGFLLVKRTVFELMIDRLGRNIGYKPDHRDRREHDFWAVGPYHYPDGSCRYLSEDWMFCQRALDLGFTVWGDTRVVLKHVGQAVYPLRTQEEQLFSSPAAVGNGTPAAGAIRPSPAPASLSDHAPYHQPLIPA